MAENVLASIKEKTDFSELDNLPETIEDIQSDPILKPLLEFHKQASMLEKEDKLEHEFLVKTKDDIEDDLKTGIYDNSNIVRKYRNLAREYDRLILIYSRYTDLADTKIIEMKKIVEKYYITKLKSEETLNLLKNEIEQLEKENKELKKQLKEKPIEKIEKPEPVNLGNLSANTDTEISNELEPEFEDEENDIDKELIDDEEKPKFKKVKLDEQVEDEDDGYDEFLKRKLPQKGAEKKVIGGKKRR
jgi:hypothetical protein